MSRSGADNPKYASMSWSSKSNSSTKKPDNNSFLPKKTKKDNPPPNSQLSCFYFFHFPSPSTSMHHRYSSTLSITSMGSKPTLGPQYPNFHSSGIKCKNANAAFIPKLITHLDNKMSIDMGNPKYASISPSSKVQFYLIAFTSVFHLKTQIINFLSTILLLSTMTQHYSCLPWLFSFSNVHSHDIQLLQTIDHS